MLVVVVVFSDAVMKEQAKQVKEEASLSLEEGILPHGLRDQLLIAGNL